MNSTTQLEQTKLPIQCKTCQKRRSMATFTTTDADTNKCNDINDKTRVTSLLGLESYFYSYIQMNMERYGFKNIEIVIECHFIHSYITNTTTKQLSPFEMAFVMPKNIH